MEHELLTDGNGSYWCSCDPTFYLAHNKHSAQSYHTEHLKTHTNNKPNIVSNDTGFKREQSDKPNYMLMPLKGLDRVAKRSMLGAAKYDEDGELNWMKADWNDRKVRARFMESFLRHAIQYCQGEVDPDTGTVEGHLDAAVWNGLAMMCLQEKADDTTDS